MSDLSFCSIQHIRHKSQALEAVVTKLYESKWRDVALKQQQVLGNTTTKWSRITDFRESWTFAWGKVDLFKFEASPLALTFYPSIHPEINMSHFGSERSVWDNLAAGSEPHRNMSVILCLRSLRFYWFPTIFQILNLHFNHREAQKRVRHNSPVSDCHLISCIYTYLDLHRTLSWCYISHHQ